MQMSEEEMRLYFSPFTRANEMQIAGLQWLYVKTVEDEASEWIIDNDESIDQYWEKGWVVRRGEMRRRNYDEIDGVYVKSFPTRYNLHEFRFSKNRKRILARNRDLECVARPLRITPAKEKLYFQHHVNRFKIPPKEPLTKTYEEIICHPAKIMEMCFFRGEELIAFSIFEYGAHAMSSHLGAWLPGEEHRSLGTFTILKEVEYAKSHCGNYYYMGPFHIHNPNYEYKTRLPGFQLYDWDNERWVRWEDPCVREMLFQVLPLRYP